MCQFSGKTDNFDFLAQIYPKNGYRVGNSENWCWSKNQRPGDTTCANFQVKQTTLTFLAQILSKNQFWGQNFKILSLDSESAAPIYHVYQFSGKFGLNLGKLPNYVRYFCSYNVEGVAESWVELGGAGWRLKWARWRWTELGARFSNTHYIITY